MQECKNAAAKGIVVSRGTGQSRDMITMTQIGCQTRAKGPERMAHEV